MLEPIPIYITASAVAGLLYGLYEMLWIRKDAKKNPEKYIKEEEPRVKSFFDVI